jgi:hypothetical protein
MSSCYCRTDANRNLQLNQQTAMCKVLILCAESVKN